MFVISNIVFMRCVLINVIINVDINRWYVFLYNYNVFWFYLFIMSILENKNVLKLGIVCFVLIY